MYRIWKQLHVILPIFSLDHPLSCCCMKYWRVVLQVLEVLCSLCVCHGVAVRSNQNLICDSLLPDRDLLLQTRLTNQVTRYSNKVFLQMRLDLLIFLGVLFAFESFLCQFVLIHSHFLWISLHKRQCLLD